jgi:hypothetical protein
MRLDSKFVTSDGGMKPGVNPVLLPSIQKSLPQLEHCHRWRWFAVIDRFLLLIVTFDVLLTFLLPMGQRWLHRYLRLIIVAAASCEADLVRLFTGNDLTGNNFAGACF